MFIHKSAGLIEILLEDFILRGCVITPKWMSFYLNPETTLLGLINLTVLTSLSTLSASALHWHIRTADCVFFLHSTTWREQRHWDVGLFKSRGYRQVRHVWVCVLTFSWCRSVCWEKTPTEWQRFSREISQQPLFVLLCACVIKRNKNNFKVSTIKLFNQWRIH